MVKAKIDVEVSGVKRTIRKIKRDLHRGMEKSVDTLVDQARRHARGVISEERAIFNAEVYSGFKDAETKNTPSQVSAKLYNDVEHAEVLEEGAAFPAEGPPVAALLPWVARKMQWGSSFDPDIYGGADYFDGSSHDGDDGRSDDGGGRDTNTTTTEKEEIRNRFNVPLRERNEIDPIPSESDKSLKERMGGDYERYYSEDFTESDLAKLEADGEVIYPDTDLNNEPVKKSFIDESTDDYLKLDVYGDQYYFFDHVTDGEKDSYLGKDGSEIEIIGITTRTSPRNLQKDDKIIIDGDKTGVDDWQDKKVYATVDNNPNTFSDDLEVHSKYSSTTRTIDAEAYEIYKGDSTDAWDFENSSRGAKVKYYNSIYDEIRSGYLTSGTTHGTLDNGKSWEVVTGNVINPETGYDKSITGDAIVSLDNSVDYFAQNTIDVPDTTGILDEPEVESLPNSISDYEKEDRYRLWNHRTGEFFDAKVEGATSNRITFSKNNNFLNKLVYRDGISKNDEIEVTPVAKYKDQGGWDVGYPVVDNQNQLWYGQEVTFERGGGEQTALVADWDSDWVYLDDDADVDKVPRIPTLEEDTKLTGGENWSDTVPPEIRAEQLESEFRYRVDHLVDDNKIIDDFAEFIRDDYFPWVKDDKTAQEALSHMSKFSDSSGAGSSGSMSPNSRVDQYHYDLTVGANRENGEYAGFDSLTTFHELQHGILQSNRLNNKGNELAKGFTGGRTDLIGPFDQWPETVFRSDGSANTNRFDEISIDKHGPIKDYTFQDQETGKRFGRTDFNDIITEVPNDDVDLGNISEPKLTDVSGPDILDESDFKLETNDVIQIKNQDGETVQAVFSSSGTSEETYFKFLDKDDEVVRIESEADGTITDVSYSGNYTDNWELDSYYENTAEPLSDPITNWMPNTNNDLEQFVTAGNRSLRKELWMMQSDDTDGDLISNRVSILRGYAASNTHETLAGLTSLMQSESYKHSSQLPKIYYHHPFLVKSYLDLYEPSAQAREILEKLDDPELNKYL